MLPRQNRCFIKCYIRVYSLVEAVHPRLIHTRLGMIGRTNTQQRLSIIAYRVRVCLPRTIVVRYKTILFQSQLVRNEVGGDLIAPLTVFFVFSLRNIDESPIPTFSVFLGALAVPCSSVPSTHLLYVLVERWLTYRNCQVTH